ncbi:MAG: ABC transporter ATP-binding protein [Clostridia bacterium]
MEEDKIYRLKNVNKIYKVADEEVFALRNVELDIIEGEICVILGPSGSGKSTMLNLLSGIDLPTSGKVVFDGGDRLDKMKDEELTEYRKDNLGFIFQSYNLVSNLTVAENVELGSHLSKNPLKIKEVLEGVGILEHRLKFPYQLSGGQMQRVAIARAIVKNPKVLFCDEPTGALDEKMGKQTLKLIQKINKEYGTTIIMVTHNPSVANIANTIVKMNSGKIVSVVKNENILDAEDIRWA